MVIIIIINNRMSATETVYSLVKYGVILGLILGFGLLLVGSILVRDTYYITKSPRLFATETALMGVLTSLPILFICYTRGAGTLKTALDTGLFFLKIVLLHLGFQLSGVYSVLFPESSNLT